MGVVREERGMQDCRENLGTSEGNWLLCAFPYAKDKKTFGLCHPKTSVRESAALFVVF